MQRPDLGIELRVWDAAFVVVLDYLFQRRNAAVVHVGGCAGNLTKRRRPECAAILLSVAQRKASLVGELSFMPSDSGIVEFLIAEIRTDVARHAIALETEHTHPR